MDVLIEELTTRRVEHRMEIHSNVFRHGGGNDSSTSLAAIIFCFTVNLSIPHATKSLMTGSSTCGHPTTPFARPGACARTLYRGCNQGWKETSGDGARNDGGDGAGAGAERENDGNEGSSGGGSGNGEEKTLVFATASGKQSGRSGSVLPHAASFL